MNKLVFEDINDEYGWGRYGDFRVLIRKADGYINATKLCHSGGRRFNKWLENKTSSELIEEVSRTSEIPTELLIQSIMTGVNETRGSYAHPDLIPHIASWMSPKFAVFVSRIIREWRQYSAQNESTYWAEIKNATKDSSIQESKEKQIQLEIAEHEAGVCEVAVGSGFIDILTDTKIIEVKTACNWKHAIGQVIVYGLSYPDRERWIYLFDSDRVSKKEIEEVCEKVCVQVKFVS